MKVDDSLRLLALLVVRHHRRDLGWRCTGDIPSGTIGQFRILLGRDVRRFRPRDLRLEIPDQCGVGIAEHLIRSPSDDPERVVRDTRELGAVGLRPEVAALAERRGVDRACLRLPHPELRQTGTHLPCRARREGDGQHSAGIVDALPHRVSDAVRDRSSLSRARSSEHHDRLVQGESHLALLGIECTENCVSHPFPPLRKLSLATDCQWLPIGCGAWWT